MMRKNILGMVLIVEEIFEKYYQFSTYHRSMGQKNVQLKTPLCNQIFGPSCTSQSGQRKKPQ
uniref:Ovule protein n=1 Tax=Romanomermis culicivorax TaxID=13658 RepID=A0A915HHH8_ROMCU